MQTETALLLPTGTTSILSIHMWCTYDCRSGGGVFAHWPHGAAPAGSVSQTARQTVRKEGRKERRKDCVDNHRPQTIFFCHQQEMHWLQ